MWISEPAPIQPQPIAGQSLLTGCGSTSVTRSKYAKEGREGGRRGRLKFSKKKKLKPHTHCTLPPYAPVGRNFTADGEDGTYVSTSDVWTIVIRMVIDRSC